MASSIGYGMSSQGTALPYQTSGQDLMSVNPFAGQTALLGQQIAGQQGIANTQAQAGITQAQIARRLRSIRPRWRRTASIRSSRTLRARWGRCQVPSAAL